ncbi:MAG: hypothetical protein ABW195_10560 [Ilumatobacteraceae bacterium]
MRARRFDERDEGPHPDVPTEEWIFASWLADGSVGVVSGYRIHRAPSRGGWYWAALARRSEPLLHVTEWEVPARSDPLLVKAHGLWAEHTVDAPMEQWTVTNETYATALDDPADALGRAYGVPSAVAFDLEWYATAPPVAVVTGDGYQQDGVVHGIVELSGGPLVLTEAPARRWHRWAPVLGVLVLPEAFAHASVRAPFAFPDGTVADWVVTPDGWRSRRPASGPVPAPAPAR